MLTLTKNNIWQYYTAAAVVAAVAYAKELRTYVDPEELVTIPARDLRGLSLDTTGTSESLLDMKTGRSSIQLVSGIVVAL